MLNRPPCGVYYVPDAYGHSTHHIVGRQSAGREFLKAYARSEPVQGFRCVADSPEDFATFLEQIEQFGGDPTRAYHVGSNDIHAISRIGTLYWPDPAIGRLAWARRSLRNDAYSLCGVTHSLSEGGAIAAVQDLIVAPTQTWDALICTSQAARRAVEAIIAGWSAYLTERIGVAAKAPVQLPVIPLGVDAERFRMTDEKAAKGRALRQRLNIPDDAVVGLYFGRFNFLTKAHPTPMFTAFAQAAASAPGIDLRLLMAGQFTNPLVEAEFRDLAQKYLGGVKIAWVDGHDADESDATWVAADFFVSLSDNVQETFGMTVLEAMAASLPCIVSDWSGLKETVVDGDTGFLVPTRMPSPDASEMVMARATFGVEGFDESIAALSQVIVVDVAHCADRIAALATNLDLRRNLGRRGRARVVSDYDWTRILPQYEALWQELSAIRATACTGRRPPVLANFGQTDPLLAFGHFATAQIARTAMISAEELAHERLARICDNPSHAVLQPLLVTHNDMKGIVAFLQETHSVSVVQVKTRFHHLRPEKLDLSLLWLAKFGIVRVRD